MSFRDVSALSRGLEGGGGGDCQAMASPVMKDFTTQHSCLHV